MHWLYPTKLKVLSLLALLGVSTVGLKWAADWGLLPPTASQIPVIQAGIQGGDVILNTAQTVQQHITQATGPIVERTGIPAGLDQLRNETVQALPWTAQVAGEAAPIIGATTHTVQEGGTLLRQTVFPTPAEKLQQQRAAQQLQQLQRELKAKESQSQVLESRIQAIKQQMSPLSRQANPLQRLIPENLNFLGIETAKKPEDCHCP